MKKRRFINYLEKRKAGTNPIKKKEEVSRHPDEKIDQDFPGFPHGQADESVIKPKDNAEKKTAAVNVKDGEKKFKTKLADEQDSEGSGGAFAATEDVRE